MAVSKFKLSDTLSFCLPLVNFYPLTLGANFQPFLSMCNAVAQVMLAPPFKHSFNRGECDFVTTQGVQSYLHLNAFVGSTAYTQGQIILDSNGNAEKILAAGTSAASAPVWPTGLFTTVQDSGGVLYQNIGTIGQLQQIQDFGYIEKAVVQDVNNNNVWKDLTVSLDVSRDTSGQSCPKIISAQMDDNIGDVMLRLTPTPAGAYPVSVQYQKAQAPYTGLNMPWSPFPDRLFYVYSFGVLALAYVYKGDSRAQWASTQFVSRMLSFTEGLQETQVQQFLRNWTAISADQVWGLKHQQGVAARGTP